MVSIIIVTMGGDEMLVRCLQSLAEHTATPHEVILVNNGAEQLAIQADIVIENGRNLGFARAVNRGIGAAQGDWILLLNPDTLFTADTITPMAAFLEEHPRAGICGVQLIFPDGRDQNSIDIIPSLANQFVNKALLKILFPKSYPSKRSGFKGPVKVPSVIGACMLLSRAMLDTIGPLDEGFFFYLEETDLCKRATLHGYEVWHLPTLKLIHYQGATAKSYDVRRKVEFNRSLWRFFRKHRGPGAAHLFAFLSCTKAAIEVITNLPLALLPSFRPRLRRSAGVLLWYVLAMPEGFGLERTVPAPRYERRGGFRWRLATGQEAPDIDPGQIMQSFSEVLNDSKTTTVKAGMYQAERIYLKRYNFKGLKDTLKNVFRTGRAFRSARAADMLAALGIDTPEVLFACEKRVFGVLLESYIATRGLEAVDLVKAVQSHGPRDMIAVARFIRRLHEMGVLPVDLKGENLLIEASGRVYLIDLDRVKRRRYLRMNSIARNLSYLNASFARTLKPETRLTFLDEYLKGNNTLVAGRRALIEKIKHLTQRRLAERY
ncbi:MAG: glycosyltransferase [Syntrophaceae bacterium]